MQITKEIIYQNLLKLLEQIFRLPDISHIRIAGHRIAASTDTEHIRQAVNDSYHDHLSDLDLKVLLTHWRPVTPAEIGLSQEVCLGLTSSCDDQGASQFFRIVLKNGMRYDIVFSALSADDANQETPAYTPAGWDLAQADSFWFIAVQALGKLYRKDHLIADHLANMLINESLVVQMVDRDNRQGTNIHRYGYEEELGYLQEPDDPRPYESPTEADPRPAAFYHIADKLFHAAAAYDRLVPMLNPDYQSKRRWFYELWKAYENEGK